MKCDFPNDAAAELACMKKVPYDDIINAMGEYQDNLNNTVPLSFSPFPDEKIVFYNYTKRYAEGRVSQVPMIYSSAANEGGSLTFGDPAEGVNQTAANMQTLTILCGAANTSKLRNSIGLPTYRYQYAGNWTNQDPLPWMGAVRLRLLPLFSFQRNLLLTYSLATSPPLP
jgi:carboxylesterase type B